MKRVQSKSATKVTQSDNFTPAVHQNKGGEVDPEVGLCAPGHGPGCVVGDSMLVLFCLSCRELLWAKKNQVVYR